MSKQLKVDQLDPGQVVEFHDPNFDWRVKAPLPEQFGYSVGSEIGTPFAGYGTDGALSKVLALQFGVSSRVGLITQKLYQGPQETEISFDLNFNAYYSSRLEVMAPIVKLMMMSVGQEQSVNDAKEGVLNEVRRMLTATDRAGSAVAEFVTGADFSIEEGSAAELIRFMRTPSLCSVRVGKIFTLNKVFISNVTPSFSNVLDNEFLPMSASCNVTIELQSPMTKLRIGKSFSIADAERENIENTEVDNT